MHQCKPRLWGSPPQRASLNTRIMFSVALRLAFPHIRGWGWYGGRHQIGSRVRQSSHTVKTWASGNAVSKVDRIAGGGVGDHRQPVDEIG